MYNASNACGLHRPDDERMDYVWKPIRDPPQPYDISAYSLSARHVLKTIRQKHAQQFGCLVSYSGSYYKPSYTSNINIPCSVARKSDSTASTSTGHYYAFSPPLSPEDYANGVNAEEQEIITQRTIITNDGKKTARSSLQHEETDQVYKSGAWNTKSVAGKSFKDNAWGDENTRRIMDGFLKTNSGESRRNAKDQQTQNIVQNFQRLKQQDIKSHVTVHHIVSLKHSKKRIRSGVKNEETDKHCESVGAPTKHISASTIRDPVTWKQESLDMVVQPDNWKEATSLEKIINVSSLLNEAEQQQMLASCLTASEIVLLLSYTGNVTHLKDRPLVRKSVTSTGVPRTGGKVACIILGVHRAAVASSTSTNTDDWRLLSVPLTDASKPPYVWCRNFLSSIMSCNVRKICFDAQELMSIVMTFTRANPMSDASKWFCLDPRVACWLIDPDDPPISFANLVSKVQGREVAHQNKARKVQETGARGLLGDICKLSSYMHQLNHWLCQRQLWDLFFQVEMPLVPILAGMEVAGIKVNQQKFHSSSYILKTRTCQLKKMAHLKAGKVFQLNSHVQLRQLVKLQNSHPLPGIILEYRKVQKLKSTYVDGFLDYVEKDRIHCTWEQTAAASGRLQSTNPNLQNIPKQSITISWGDSKENVHHTLHMREPFVSREGHSLISADFQSIELRILAHFSKDEHLLKIFCDDDQSDIFVQIACQWMGLSVGEVSEEKREKTKRIVYSVVYGAGSEKIAETLGVSHEKARAFTKSFLDKFPGIKQFTQSCISQCRKQGFVTSLLHRQRIIKNIGSGNIQQRLHAERQAVNFVIQGSAADICKVAMLCTVKQLRQRPHLQPRLLIQIHDELLFEVPDDQVTEVKELIKGAMESVARLEIPSVNLRTPLPVSLSVGKDWGHLMKC